MILFCSRLWTTLFLAQKDAQFEWATFCSDVLPKCEVELAVSRLKELFKDMDAVGLQDMLNESFEHLKTDMDASHFVPLKDPDHEGEGVTEAGDFEGNSDDA